MSEAVEWRPWGVPPERIARASYELANTRLMERCGRPTKSGRPCRNRQVRWIRVCMTHALPYQLFGYELRRSELQRMVDEFWASLEPAFMTWPAPEPGMRLWDWQDGRCAVCGGRMPYDLVLDHDHETGLIRGYLCRSCNGTEAHAGKEHGAFRRYRERPPAALLGIRETYADVLYGPALPTEPAPDYDQED